jgi:hypothetical protein
MKDEKRLGILTHNDLDGMGCYILLKRCLKIHDFIFSKNHEIIKNLNKLRSKGCNELIITDLSLTQNEIDLADKLFDKVIWIDHHLTSYDVTAPFKSIINNKASGTLLTLYYLNKKGIHFNKGMKTLVKYINDYDLWEHKYKESLLLNNILYDGPLMEFYDEFKNGIGDFEDHNNEKRKRAEEIQEQKEDTISKFETYDIEGILKVVIADSYISDISLYYKDFDNFVILQKDYKLSIRSKNDMSEFYKLMKDKGFAGGGHKNAGGAKVNNDEEFMEFVELFYNFMKEFYN